MSSRHSFRTRLAVQTMLVSGVVLTVFGAASWWYARQQLARAVDVRIAEAAHRIWTRITPRTTSPEFAEAMLDADVTAVVLSNEPDGSLLFASNPEFAGDLSKLRPFLPGSALLDSVRDELDRRGLRRPDREGPPPGEPEPGGVIRRPLMPEIREPVYFTITVAGGQWRIGAFSSPNLTLFTGLSLDEFHAAARRAAWWYAAAGALGLALAGIGAWWTSRRAMRPLDRIVATAQHLTATELDRRIPSGPRDDREFTQLIGVLNGMMDRLQTSFEQAARFTADASHELKTPLAVMQVTLHDSLRRGTLAQDEMESLARECARLKGITHSLLLLSQADAGKLPLTRERYDLSADLARLVEDADALCEQVGLSCEHYLADALHIVADRTLMRHVFQNLLNNAVKYNRPGGLVKITLAPRGDHAAFTIVNTGAGIPPAAQARLFERFFRGDASRASDGAGLGLNIAFELAHANGADLRLVESGEDHTCFEVRIALHGEDRV